MLAFRRGLVGELLACGAAAISTRTESANLRHQARTDTHTEDMTMSYAAPTREMLFVMKEIGGLDAVLQQPGHEEVDPTWWTPSWARPTSSPWTCWRR